MNSIEIFKTNVKSKRIAHYLIHELNEVFPDHKVSIDLDDSDKVLRVENRKGNIESTEIIKLLNKRNLHCEVLNS